jgi:predicted RecA/RadA family phage recombinase
MKNFRQPGDTVTLTAPAVTGCKSGDVIVSGALIGVAAYDAVAGAEVEVTLVGVWELPKAAGQLTEGQAVAWDDSAHNVCAPGAGKYPIGAVVEGAATDDATCLVRLSGVPTAAAGA